MTELLYFTLGFLTFGFIRKTFDSLIHKLFGTHLISELLKSEEFKKTRKTFKERLAEEMNKDA